MIDKRNILYVDASFGYSSGYGVRSEPLVEIMPVKDVDVYITPDSLRGSFLASAMSFDMLALNLSIQRPGEMIHNFRRRNRDSSVVVYTPHHGMTLSPLNIEGVFADLIEYQENHCSSREKIMQAVRTLDMLRTGVRA